MKKKYGIIGKPLSHSLSPTLHNYWFKKYNLDAEYLLLEIKEAEIEKILNKVRSKEINGINVTLPYKQKVIPFLDELGENSSETKSVNTIWLQEKNKALKGDNTDVFGLLAGYFKEIIGVKNLNTKVLILGAGGVAPSVIYALQKSLVNNIYLSNRTQSKSIFLKKKFKNIKILEWKEVKKSVENFDIIINATSLGLKGGDNFDFSFNNCKASMIYIDTIYNPLKTKMIEELNNQEIKTFNGLDMFLYQGQKSFYLWHEINPEINDELINLLKKKIK
jgi:shikimate dehydrogenase|tara:strand:+ start:2692 stop:3522 length:831 start_codon:yes stop_codon:yes gene_type:complete